MNVFSAPDDANIEGLTSRSLKVTIIPSDNANGTDRYSADIFEESNNFSHYCEVNANNSATFCVIDGLSAGTTYNVNVTAWLGGNFRDVGSSIQRKGQTKPSSELKHQRVALKLLLITIHFYGVFFIFISDNSIVILIITLIIIIPLIVLIILVLFYIFRRHILSFGKDFEVKSAGNSDQWWITRCLN